MIERRFRTRDGSPACRLSSRSPAKEWRPAPLPRPSYDQAWGRVPVRGRPRSLRELPLAIVIDLRSPWTTSFGREYGFFGALGFISPPCASPWSDRKSV